MYLWPRVIEEKWSAVNGTVKVYEFLGKKSISVDNLTQSGGLVENIWDKGLKTVARDKLPVNKVLILGLGGGTAAKLINRRWPETEVTGVDIDPVMVELGQKYLGLRDVNIVIADAAEFIKKLKEKFDGVLVDVYQGRNIPESVTSVEFLKNLKKQSRWIIFNRLKTNKEFRKSLEAVWTGYRIINTPANELLLVQL